MTRVRGAVVAVLAALVVMAAPVAAWANKPARPSIVVFDPAKYKGKTGKIVLPFKGESFLYAYKIDQGKQTPYILKSKTGTFAAPVGSFRLLQYYASYGTSKGGRPWRLSGRFDKPLAIKVGSGTTYQIKGGAPFTAWVKVQQSVRSRVSMDLVVLGRGGERCTIYSASRKDPRFRILSKTGKVLQEGKFEYG